MLNFKKKIILAVTGASGAPYALRLLEHLVLSGVQVSFLISPAGALTIKEECGLHLPAKPEVLQQRLTELTGATAQQILCYGRNDWFAPMASGSAAFDAMIICPCTMRALAAVAMGLSDSLIERAADVMLKERRQLILVPREMPLSVIHLENMLKLARAGAEIIPPMPGFYYHPDSVDDLIDFVVARLLDRLGLVHSLGQRWGGER
ncbi:putative aromatic acid decarboxylase [Piscirickettsia salmonis]|uniref:flavin prenyltransferase UbiX n=1 Tax=Piscirickettsia salmonis TaxID=1238 RepID=UPI0012B77AA3|nr:flavin prenyltransferase UbiX [Piscirickettsia salmonis]QGP51496.1 putative aromatic acid decarboxylase [Piscirickettsia salmonis]QGP53318.1 putative aromatic acid decarboxylase [Piscirickettsia salmonis]QGP60761.1 putative aromatic acid decarboxylase [Piscirickettsia salmonis]QGP62883.1 putative aromatic acid decarboxylase [Piscirickettsia salmonis]